MKQTLDLKQTSYFNHHHYLELEGLLKDTDALLELIQNRHESHDLFAHDTSIRKIALRKSFAHIAQELFGQRLLRLAFDHVLPSKGPSPFQDTLTLRECCSFQGLIGGLILRLTSTNTPIIDATPLCPLPLKKGSGIIFSADLPINWQHLLSLKGETLYLIGYATFDTVYILNPKDPLTHTLKADGYVFGDRLRNDRHPLLK